MNIILYMFFLLFKDPDTDLWEGLFWGYSDTRSVKFNCLSVQAQASTMKDFLIQNTTGK